MLYIIKNLENMKISNKIENLGYLNDFYIDDLSWTTRYVVLDTGNWLTGKKILISPHSIDKPNFLDNIIYTNLTKEKIANSPEISEVEPVSRKHELKLLKYYGWPPYWTFSPSMQNIVNQNIKDQSDNPKANFNDSHLRSIREIRKYYIQGLDDEIGVVDSFIIDDHNWIIKYLVLDTRIWLHWLPGGKKVLVAPEWIRNIEWKNSKMYLNLDRETIEKSPEFKSAEEIDEEYENKLYACYKEFIDKIIVDV